MKFIVITALAFAVAITTLATHLRMPTSAGMSAEWVGNGRPSNLVPSRLLICGGISGSIWQLDVAVDSQPTITKIDLPTKSFIMSSASHGGNIYLLCNQFSPDHDGGLFSVDSDFGDYRKLIESDVLGRRSICMFNSTNADGSHYLIIVTTDAVHLYHTTTGRMERSVRYGDLPFDVEGASRIAPDRVVVFGRDGLGAMVNLSRNGHNDPVKTIRLPVDSIVPSDLDGKLVVRFNSAYYSVPLEAGSLDFSARSILFNLRDGFRVRPLVRDFQKEGPVLVRSYENPYHALISNGTWTIRIEKVNIIDVSLLSTKSASIDG